MRRLNVINYKAQTYSNINSFTLDFNQTLIEENPLNHCTDFNRSFLFFIEVVMFRCTRSPGDCRDIFNRTPALISVLDLFPQLLCSISSSVRLGLQRTGNPIDTSRD